MQLSAKTQNGVTFKISNKNKKQVHFPACWKQKTVNTQKVCPVWKARLKAICKFHLYSLAPIPPHCEEEARQHGWSLLPLTQAAGISELPTLRNKKKQRGGQLTRARLGGIPTRKKKVCGAWGSELPGVLGCDLRSAGLGGRAAANRVDGGQRRRKWRGTRKSSLPQ